MALTPEDLCRDEWVNAGLPEIRLRFRKDGSGYYDRKADGKIIHEKLLFRIDGALKIKFVHAREWTEVVAAVGPGKSQPGERVGERELVLSNDPYCKAIEDKPSPELRLMSDAGASLPSS
jgi:hypothetical protein